MKNFKNTKANLLLAGLFCFILSVPVYSDVVVGWGGRKPPGEPLEGLTRIAAGANHSLALKSDGSIVGWGWNSRSQASPPDGNDFVAITAGFYHSTALKRDGSIVAWGISNGDILDYDYGQVTDTPDGNDFVAIAAAGGWHNLALKSDGSIVGWGRNDSDQASPPDGNDFVAIAAGFKHSLALKQDGSIVQWGSGHTSPPDGNDFVAIAAGGYYSLALKDDGSIVGGGPMLPVRPARPMETTLWPSPPEEGTAWR